MLEFKKFPSLENTYRTKEVHFVEELGYDKGQYVVTEKVHGANFSFHIFKAEDGVVNIKCAKRSGWIEEDEKFFNYKTVLEKYKDSLLSVYDSLDVNTLSIYGEIYGGNIQAGMCYCLEQDFVMFDVHVEGVPINKLNLFDKDAEYYGLKPVPLIGVYPSLQEALDVQEYFTSKLKREDFNGDDKFTETEGIVIEPVTPCWYPNGSRVYFKKKTKRFLEKGGNKIPKPKEGLPPELEGILLQGFEYITKPRFEAVVSKIGEVSIKDIGKVTGLMTKDILEDMRKDEKLIPDNKQFMKLLQTQVQTFIRPILLNL